MPESIGEAIGAEEANIKALRTPADSFHTRFIHPLAPHNKLTGGCQVTSQGKPSEVPDDREESLSDILQKGQQYFANLRASNQSTKELLFQKVMPI